jgi:site-specific DNA-methyltransferase (adenine-specific)
MTREHLEAIRDLVDDIPAWVEAECDKRTVESQNMAAREVVGERIVPVGHSFAGETYQGDNTGSKEYTDTLPSTPEAVKWSGWGTALKPAFEPIVVARKPLIGTVAQNVLEHGTGALNINACRIQHGDDVNMDAVQRQQRAEGSVPFASAGLIGKEIATYKPGGRWPANVVLDETAGAILDEQSGWHKDGTAYLDNRTHDYNNTSYQIRDNRTGTRGYHGEGGASRFFYCAKASKKDRNTNGAANTHPTVKPTELMRWLIRLVTPPGGIILDPFGGSGSTGVAAQAESVRCILIEREAEYLAIIRERLDDGSLFSQLP